ncbi:glutamate receptor ionotropic, kainate 1-like [Octopus sinensis]|uniref:Glutamate receptor ionotropic, kainate 1-like n=1 Tax=Octopus sinensis TaxID=2607531 RepID=A0A6P7TDD1_9MOLL|nr:glutamate receptor ionotropic, kainate 1-like [Octopus sinensis]
MLSASYHFIFTTLDLTLIDLEEFKYGGANITAVRMIDSLRPFVSEVTQDWVMEEKRTGNSPIKGLKTEIPTETALMYDAVYLFAKALHQVAAARDINTMALSCTKQNTWNHGNSVLNYMKTVVFDGLSGRVMFDHKGERSDFSLNVLKLKDQGLTKQPFCTEVSQELRVAITCLGSSRKNGKTKSDDARLDNHQLVPLTSGQNSFLTKDMNT